ncbi:MAG: hypothetical protein AB8G18_13705 [Gammaproteobacteria bacterium]
MNVLRTAFVAQLLVMLSGFVVLVVSPADFSTLGLLVFLVIVAVVVCLYAVSQFFLHRSRRRWAEAIGRQAVCFRVSGRTFGC